MSQLQWTVSMFVGSSSNRNSRWTDVTTATPIPAAMVTLVNEAHDWMWNVIHPSEPTKPYAYNFYITLDDDSTSFMSQVSFDPNP